MLASYVLALATFAADGTPQWPTGRNVEIPAAPGGSPTQTNMRRLVQQTAGSVDDAFAPGRAAAPPRGGATPFAGDDLFNQMDRESPFGTRAPGTGARRGEDFGSTRRVSGRPSGAAAELPRGQSPSLGDGRDDQASSSQTKESRQWSLLVFFLLVSIGVNIYQWIWYMKMRLRQQSLLFRMHDRVENRDPPDRGWTVEVDRDDEDRMQRRSA